MRVDYTAHQERRYDPPAPNYPGDLHRRWGADDASASPPPDSDEDLPPAPTGLLALREAHPRDRVWAWLRPASTGEQPAVVWIGGHYPTDPSVTLAADGPLADLLAADINLLVLRRASAGLWDEDGLLDSVRAVQHAREDLAKRPTVREDRVYLIGSGEGGQAALLQATLAPELRAVLVNDPVDYGDHDDRDCRFGVASFLEQLTTPAILADDRHAADTVARARFVGAPVRLLETATFGGRVAPGDAWPAAIIAADTGPTFAVSDATLDALRSRAYLQALDDAADLARAAIDAHAHAPFGDLASGAVFELREANAQVPRALAQRLIAELAGPVITAKRAEEQGWPELTDNDRLDSALRRFASDDRRAQQQCYEAIDWDCSWTVGATDAQVTTYTLATDIQRARTSGELPIRFWASNTRAEGAAHRDLLRELQRAGLSATWDGDPARDILVHLTWQRRLPR